MRDCDGPIPHCQDCAACCFFEDDDRKVELENVDFARLTFEEQVSLTVFEGGRCWMRVRDGHCAALAARDGRWACSIHGRHPGLCVGFDRGGAACWWERGERYALARARLGSAPSGQPSDPR